MASQVNKPRKANKPEPPSLVLLALVSQFLANNGFSSSSRIFNTERKKRPKKEGWVGTLGKDFTAKYPPLETLFKQWEEQQKGAKKRDGAHTESSSDEGSESSDSGDSSSSGSSSDSDSESGSDTSGKVKSMKKAAIEEIKASRKSQSSSSSDSDSESSSDSDTELVISEKEIVAQVKAIAQNPLKRKASDTSDSSSDSSADGGSSSSEDEPPATKKARVDSSDSESDSDSDSESESESESESASDELTIAANTKLPSSNASEDSSSEDSSSDSSGSSDSESEEDEGPNPKGAPVREERLSESSGTVTGDTKGPEFEPDVANHAVVPVDENGQIIVKKKHIGARPTRLAQLSAIAKPDEYISNEYVSYDYAEKAYRDLIVTRGKGFTKEKNKKKRGSYRGGIIDTSGGKGFKFED